MRQIEQALVDQCINQCTIEMYRTLKRFKFKNPNIVDKVLIKYDIEKIMSNYLKEFEKCQ